jgi:hypothetical protein
MYDMGLGRVPTDTSKDPYTIVVPNLLETFGSNSPDTIAAWLKAGSIALPQNVISVFGQGTPVTIQATEGGGGVITSPVINKTIALANNNSNATITGSTGSASNPVDYLSPGFISKSNTPANNTAPVDPNNSVGQPSAPPTSNWFTDSSLISGVPNWALLAGGFAAMFLLKK